MRSDIILLGHGSGGRLSHQLLEEVILPILSGAPPREHDDAAVFALAGGRLAFTTDSYVVDPVFFPGGNIGDLAVYGTVNDLAMRGARPVALSVGLILEEGLPLLDLRTILESMRAAAEAAGVRILTGDTKVVPWGKADRIFINTAGIGVFDHDLEVRGAAARPEDQILLSGAIGDHGMAVLAGRNGLQLPADIRSDTAPLHGLTAEILRAGEGAVHVLRDPTRGGVATALKEIAVQSEVDLLVYEQQLPVHPAVAGACSILGLDPLYVANEGKLLAVVAPQRAETVLEVMRRHPLGRESARIGEVLPGIGGVFLATAVGGRRIIDMLSGDQLPRIC